MTTLLAILLIFILVLVIWALFGKGGGSVKDQETKPEAGETPLRRRAADKAIEEQFPDAEIHPFRRKEDIEALEEISKVDEDFKLPYSANEIIPEGSKYWVYNRILMNSEIYARKGDFPTAISLYKGVYERIIDQQVNDKIRTNVDYLQEYQKARIQKQSEAARIKAIEKNTEKKGNEIKLSLDGPIKIPDRIEIALTQPLQEPAPKFDIDKIVDEIAEKIAAKALKEAKADQSELEDLKAKSEEVSKLKDGLSKLQDRLFDMHYEGEETKKEFEELKSRLEEAGEAGEAEKEKPALEEAKFQMQVPKPKLVEPPEEEPEELEEEKAETPEEPEPIAEEPEKKVEEVLRKVEDKEDDKEEVELLSQFEKEEELSALSDEDIFEKILRDDIAKKKDESFEIVGYNKGDEAHSDDLNDRELEEKQKEEEQFYRKFLRHGKRVRKELPILKVSFDFSKLPDEFGLSKDQNILQYSFYKFKPMLEKANEYIRRRNVREAINYYNVVKDQNIPPAFKVMLDKNISELTEYIEKYLAAD
ncbi:MAG: hypothetical protein V1874_09765 [Spirochaetota bacterium]